MRCRLGVYAVDQCGYFEHGNRTPVCSELGKCLSDLSGWIVNQRPTIETTSTFAVDDVGEQLPVYCFDAAGHANGDFLITTWNQTHSGEGTVGAVRRSAVAGNANVQTANFGANAIPGYATHFWFLTDCERVVTARLDPQELNGHGAMDAYMRGYLERFSPHVRFADPTDDGNIFTRNVLGYALDDANPDGHARIRPRFRTTLLRRGAELDFIRANRSRITRVIRKSRPSAGGQAARSLLDQALQFVGGTLGNRQLPDQQFTFEIPYTPTAPELENIINRFQSADHETWDDVGFEFSRENSPRWLSQSTLKITVEAADGLHDGPGSVAPAAALLQELQAFRRLLVV